MPVSKSFLPSIIHPFYFIRKGLYKGIKNKASALSGVLLDFGCGQKPYKSLFNVEKYIGLDFENPGHSHANEDIDVFYDGKDIPFDDAYFDSVFSSEVFEHIFDLDKSLMEINRVLKTGGKLLITCPFVFNEHETPHDFARYTTFALNHLFIKYGFTVIDYEKQGNFIETIAQTRVLYFQSTFYYYFRRLPVGSVINKLIVAILNLSGIIKSFILPVRKDFYLSNIFLVQKN